MKTRFENEHKEVEYISDCIEYKTFKNIENVRGKWLKPVDIRPIKGSDTAYKILLRLTTIFHGQVGIYKAPDQMIFGIVCLFSQEINDYYSKQGFDMFKPEFIKKEEPGVYYLDIATTKKFLSKLLDMSKAPEHIIPLVVQRYLYQMFIYRELDHKSLPIATLFPGSQSQSSKFHSFISREKMKDSPLQDENAQVTHVKRLRGEGESTTAVAMKL